MTGRPEPRETVVRSGQVPVAVRDYGGDGPPVILLHGAGGNVLAWEKLAPCLTGAHRLVAVDLRGHGHSGDGPWGWDAVLDDIDAVVDQLGVDAPAVVGHSLGGMLAGMWACRHPECPAAVSLDGHRSAETYAGNYAGLAPEQVHHDLAQLKQVFDTQALLTSKALTDDMVEMLTDQQRATAVAAGADPDLAVATLNRGLLVDDHGQTWLRPSPSVSGAIRESPEFKDCLPVFAEVRIPFLMVLATRILPSVPPNLGPLLDAFRAGVRRDFEALTARNPYLHVLEFDASHGLVFEKPEAVATVVGGFLERHVRT
jgi:pimeloyl-ACP methyl ester carboxylesterase